MAGIITISPGHDASYPWRQIGTSADTRARPRRPPSYYLSPPTRAASRRAGGTAAGVAELGFRDGQVIDREVFERLYGKFLDPRDPAGRDAAGPGAAAVPFGEEIYAGCSRWSRKPPPSAAPS